MKLITICGNPYTASKNLKTIKAHSQSLKAITKELVSLNIGDPIKKRLAITNLFIKKRKIVADLNSLRRFA